MGKATQMLPEDLQRSNEYLYSRKHIDKYLQLAIKENSETEAKVQEGVALLTTWQKQTYDYDSKNARLAQLEGLDMEKVVRNIFVGIAYCQLPELFVSVTAQLAARLAFGDRVESITTVAEMVAVLCQTDAFDINKESKAASMTIQSRMPLPRELTEMVERALYLPPMVCEPKDLTSNFESPYLTHNDCLLLGKHNSHDGDLCLDVINLQNQVPLALDKDFLSTVEEVPTFALNTQEKQRLWHQFSDQSHEVYLLLLRQKNRFWLTNKVDKRGRLYSQGYHVTSQGSSYKKAMIEFADPEIVKGVPHEKTLRSGLENYPTGP